MMRSLSLMTSKLISGTTNGMLGSERHADEFGDARTGKDLALIVFAVKPVADDCLCNGERDDGNDEIRRLFQQGFGGSVIGIIIRGIQPGQQQQQNLGTETADGKNHRILCELFVFVQDR